MHHAHREVQTQILRAFCPPHESKKDKEEHLVVLETLNRTYYLQAPSREARIVWEAILNVVAERNADQGTMNTSH